MAELAEYRCFVGGLAWATDDSRLETAFRPYGEVVESKVPPFCSLPHSSVPPAFRTCVCFSFYLSMLCVSCRFCFVLESCFFSVCCELVFGCVCAQLCF